MVLRVRTLLAPGSSKSPRRAPPDRAQNWYNTIQGILAVGIVDLAYCSDHRNTSRSAEFLAHAFAGVASPALHVSTGGKYAAVQLCQLVLMQPRFRAAAHLIRIIKHEGVLIRMTEILEIRYAYLLSRLPRIETSNHILPIFEWDQVQSIGVAN